MQQPERSSGLILKISGTNKVPIILNLVQYAITDNLIAQRYVFQCWNMSHRLQITQCIVHMLFFSPVGESVEMFLGQVSALSEKHPL